MKRSAIVAILVSAALIGCAAKPKQQKSVTLKCGGSINKLLSDGWKVVSSSESQIQCGSSRQFAGMRPSPVGNTYPDVPVYNEVPVMGTQVEYILEK